MKWLTNTREPYQQTEQGTAKAHEYYYIYKIKAGEWRAGRHSYGQDVDYRLDFSSAKVARDYLEQYDREAVLITAM